MRRSKTCGFSSFFETAPRQEPSAALTRTKMNHPAILIPLLAPKRLASLLAVVIMLDPAMLSSWKLLLTPLLTAVLPAAAAVPTIQQLEFFESKIRPVFVENCYTCHSEKAEKLKGGLRLDTPEGVLKGGTSGAVLVPGNPEASLLIKAVRYTDPDLQMPPKNKKLSDQQIASLEAWVKMGAPLPASTNSPRLLTDPGEARARHWAFQSLKKPPVPTVKNNNWVRTPVDNFVLAALEKKHLKPAPPADRRTLIRRVTYDLLGLPPTWEEVDAFTHDKRPEAYAQLIERLLVSPHYGERWARHWLDIARFADTKGYLPGGEERRYAFSYTYRDYVVRAFNEDKPYDQFLIDQIAADKLPQTEDKRALAALGFLTLGRRFLNNQNDIIDDRIDVITRGTLGLTVGCARCHDHKFDPIPTRDYYALHGVFASTEEPGELPLLGPLRDSTDYQDYLKQKAKIEAEIPEYKAREVAKFIDELRQHVGDYLLGAREATNLEDQAKFDLFAGGRKLNPHVLRRWMKDLEARGKKPDPIFDPWFALAKLPAAGFATNAPTILAKFTADPIAANPALAKLLTDQVTNSLKEVAEFYTKIFREINTEGKAAVPTSPRQLPCPIPTARHCARCSLPTEPPSTFPNLKLKASLPENLARARPRFVTGFRPWAGLTLALRRAPWPSWTAPHQPIPTSFFAATRATSVTKSHAGSSRFWAGLNGPPSPTAVVAWIWRALSPERITR